MRLSVTSTQQVAKAHRKIPIQYTSFNILVSEAAKHSTLAIKNVQYPVNTKNELPFHPKNAPSLPGSSGSPLVPTAPLSCSGPSFLPRRASRPPSFSSVTTLAAAERAPVPAVFDRSDRRSPSEGYHEADSFLFGQLTVLRSMPRSMPI